MSPRCPLIGRTVRDGGFRTVYDAAIIAMSRSGERIKRKIGDIVLRAGDTLLLEAHPSFAEQQRNSHHFYLVSRVPDSVPVRHERAYVALAILLMMILAASFTALGMLKADVRGGSNDPRPLLYLLDGAPERRMEDHPVHRRRVRTGHGGE